MSEAQVIEAEVVEETTASDPEHTTSPTPGSAVAVRPPGHEVLMPMDTESVVKGMEAYQALLPKLLADSDYQAADGKRFVKKSGWRKIARAFNLSVLVISCEVERDENGNAVRATTIARAMAPNGQVSDADGYCSADEKRFDSARGRQKLENDLRATATTRAKNRAISDLVGMGEVSAEEVDVSAPSMPLATEKQCETLNAALAWLLPPESVIPTWNEIRKQCGGSMYGPVANSVVVAIKARRDVEAGEVEPEEVEGVESDLPADNDFGSSDESNVPFGAGEDSPSPDGGYR